MSLYELIKNYQPVNEQETCDKEQMLLFMEKYQDYLSRDNQIAHFTASIWTVNKERTKTLMVYHNLYDSWAWIGGHADGEEDLCAVAMRELQEETGVKFARLVSPEILSLETLTVMGHVKRGKYVPSHLHFNLTFLAEADEGEELIVKADENQAVKWFILHVQYYKKKPITSKLKLILFFCTFIFLSKISPALYQREIFYVYKSSRFIFLYIVTQKTAAEVSSDTKYK